MQSIGPAHTGGLSRRQARCATPAISLRAMLLDPADSTLIQFGRYTIVGGLAFIADFSALFALTRFGGVHYLISAAVAFLAGLGINYLLSAAWVFSRRTIRNRGLEFGIFAAVGLIGLCLNEAGMWLLAGLAGLNYLWAKAATAVAVYMWNFGARKAALFR
jgi:putative flippase GtrA